ncbi:MAG: TetR/AcrR family transcriptional regulator [Candidatus Wallbacteria bacterium]|nr:TetR/AcrR family transcriptional regulator [Candidatus Wallbacteria bacterium]
MKKDFLKEKRIMESAVKIFARDGFERATVDEIAADAGVGKGTIYRYYNSKEEILRSIFQILITELRVSLRAVTRNYENDFSGTYTAVMKHYFDFFRERKETFILINEINSQLLHDFFDFYLKEMHSLVDLIEDKVREGLIRPVKPETVLLSILGIFNIFLYREIRLGIKMTKNVFNDIHQFISIGLLTEKGIKTWKL